MIRNKYCVLNSNREELEDDAETLVLRIDSGEDDLIYKVASRSALLNFAYAVEKERPLWSKILKDRLIGVLMHDQFFDKIADKKLKIPTLTEILQMQNETDVRRSGKTTRLIQVYIDQLFETRGERVFIRDHKDEEQCHIDLANKIINRINSEMFEIARFLEYDNHNISLTLKKEE